MRRIVSRQGNCLYQQGLEFNGIGLDVTALELVVDTNQQRNQAITVKRELLVDRILKIISTPAGLCNNF